MNEIGDKINNLRKDKALSQETFAEAVGVSRQTVYKWEAGIVLPSKEKIDKICAVFEVTKEYFLGSEAIAEVAVADSNQIKKDKKTLKILTAILISVAVILALLSVVTVVIGISVFPSNQGDMVVVSPDIESYVFYIFLCVTIALFIGLIVLLSVFFRFRLKCKHNVNRM